MPSTLWHWNKGSITLSAVSNGMSRIVIWENEDIWADHSNAFVQENLAQEFMPKHVSGLPVPGGNGSDNSPT